MNQPLEIPLSVINGLPFEFGGAVDSYIKEMVKHQGTTGEAAPTAPHPLVERAVARVQHPVDAGRPDDFVSNWRPVDDTPPPPSLLDRKLMLASALTNAANELIGKVAPLLKQNHWQMQYGDAIAVDEKKRTAGHKATISQHEAREAKVQAIRRHLFKAHADIDDLTDKTIDGWSAPPFPT